MIFEPVAIQEEMAWYKRLNLLAFYYFTSSLDPSANVYESRYTKMFWNKIWLVIVRFRTKMKGPHCCDPLLYFLSADRKGVGAPDPKIRCVESN